MSKKFQLFIEAVADMAREKSKGQDYKDLNMAAEAVFAFLESEEQVRSILSAYPCSKPGPTAVAVRAFHEAKRRKEERGKNGE